MKKLLVFSFLLLVIGGAAQNRYKIIAYYTGSPETIEQYPLDKLTHVIYSFLSLQHDTLAFRNDAQLQAVQRLVGLKSKYPGLKIMVSIGGWGGCSPCSELFASAEHRNVFAQTTVSLLRQYNIDGLDLDWEYPAIPGYPGHGYDSADKNNFTELVIALRKEMKNDFLLSFAAGGFTRYLEHSIDWDAVMPQVDFVNLMTYDLVGGYSKVTGHHTLLHDYEPEQESTSKCIQWLMNRNVAKEKLVPGAAFYARIWQDVENVDHGLYQAGNFRQTVPFRNFLSYFNDSLGYKYYWDRKAKAPFQYSKSKKLFASFDDERSIKAKTKFIRREKLGGIMFWQLADDQFHGGLVDAIYNGLNR